MLPTEFVMVDQNSTYSMNALFFPLEQRGVLGLALRVPLAVTWLTVYRQLHIPVRIVWAQRRVRTNVWAGGL